jgi:predicted phosphodiesterase
LPRLLPPLKCSETAQVAVVGDVHLQRAGGRTSCNVSAAVLRDVAAHLYDVHDVVVVNGDFFDLDRSPTPFAWERELDHLEQLHADVVAAFRRPRFRWTFGNHDRVLGARGLADEALELSLRCGRIRIEHGHRFDSPLKQLRLFTSLVTWTNGRVEALGLGMVDAAMRVLDRQLTGRRPGHCPIAFHARAWLDASPEFAALIIGHTHRELIDRNGDGVVANPGGSTDAVRWVSLDGETGTLTLNRWDDGAPIEVARTRVSPP